MDYVFLDTAESTMAYASAHQHDLGDMTMISVHNQLSGRGQRGNSWESEPGRNLTVTLFYRPDVETASSSDVPLAERQFRISEAAALAVADTLKAFGIDASLKWPNDIYVDDCKICGILIEHTIIGSRIADSRIGIGLNVNQTLFKSNAPNPVSMKQLTGKEYSLPAVLDELSYALAGRLSDLTGIHAAYLRRLWRADGRMHLFRPRKSNLSASFVQDGDPDIFSAVIDTVLPDGHLILSTSESRSLSFSFKEIEFILSLKK